MPDAAELLADACTSKVACLQERELWIVVAQALVEANGSTVTELLAAACESKVACLTNRDLQVVIAQALAELVPSTE